MIVKSKLRSYLPFEFLLLLSSLQTFLVYFFVSHEDRIYFYDPRGFQEMAMRVSRAFRESPEIFLNTLISMSKTEYPPYWTLPFVGISPGSLNDRGTYIVAMTIVSLIPFSIASGYLTSLITRANIKICFLTSFLTPLPFIVNLQGVPDLIGYTFVITCIIILYKDRLTFWRINLFFLASIFAVMIKKNFLFDLIFIGIGILLFSRQKFDISKSTGIKLFASWLFAIPIFLYIFNRGVFVAIFSRDNNLFYSSYQLDSFQVISSHAGYAGGLLLGLISLWGIVRIALKADRNAKLLLFYLSISFVFWSFIQKQPGVIHAIHYFGLAIPVGLVAFMNQFKSNNLKYSLILLQSLLFFVSIFPGGGFIETSRNLIAKSNFIAPTFNLPTKQQYLNEIINIAKKIEVESNSEIRVFIPIGSNIFNEEMIRQTIIQRDLKPILSLQGLPQVDGRDPHPASFIFNDQEFLILLSKNWIPDLQNGRENTISINRLLLSNQMKQFILSSENIGIKDSAELSDLKLVRMLIPSDWIMDNIRLIDKLLGPMKDSGFPSSFEILASNQSNLVGPSALTIKELNVSIQSLGRMVIRTNNYFSKHVRISDESCARVQALGDSESMSKTVDLEVSLDNSVSNTGSKFLLIENISKGECLVNFKESMP
jgi:hypothetical protein